MPKMITLKEARTAYSLAIEASQLSQGPIFVEHKGRLMAVIMSIEDYRQRPPDEYDAWRQEQLQRLEPNRSAFQQLLPELLKIHRNQFVAIYQGRLVDADPDRTALVRRTRAHGYRPVYIQKVTKKPRVVELPSPTSSLPSTAKTSPSISKTPERRHADGRYYPPRPSAGQERFGRCYRVCQMAGK